ncbi:hypothetical protein [Bdellovibrio sp. BCCA]|uniref:hypothetical protein n=1 Tax=Bdellovibrio sp. BCCA TaxID=3136281 RepID=UPI0030F1BC8D
MKLAVVSFVFFISSFSVAATKVSQNLSPNGGESEILLGVAYLYQKAGVDTIGEAKLNGYAVIGSYYYGTTDEHAFGVTLGYASSETKMDYVSATDITTKSKGLTDIRVGYKGTYGRDNITFFTNMALSLPTEKRKFNEDKNEDNVSTGRITPHVEAGLVNAKENVSFGALVALDFPFEGDAENTESGMTTAGKSSGGSKVKLATFVEFNNIAHPNIELSYNSTDSTTYKFGTTTRRYSDIKMASLNVSGRFEIVPGFELLPEAQYNRLMNKQDLQIDTYEDYGFGLAGRFVF